MDIVTVIQPAQALLLAVKLKLLVQFNLQVDNISNQIYQEDLSTLPVNYLVK